jgi:hypothetical protein
LTSESSKKHKRIVSIEHSKRERNMDARTNAISAHTMAGTKVKLKPNSSALSFKIDHVPKNTAAQMDSLPRNITNIETKSTAATRKMFRRIRLNAYYIR